MKRRTLWRTFSALCLTVLLAVSFFCCPHGGCRRQKGGDGVYQSWKELEGKRIGERYSRRNVIFPGLRLPLRRNAPKVLTFLNPIMYAGQLSPC